DAMLKRILTESLADVRKDLGDGDARAALAKLLSPTPRLEGVSYFCKTPVGISRVKAKKGKPGLVFQKKKKAVKATE
ncbi:unnamed protein product, partial [Prorocentrum cordatum]